MGNTLQAGGAALITGATVIDGTAAPAFSADIVVENGAVTAIEAPRSVPGDGFAARIDASGLVVCPGFIDVHSHADNAPLLA